MKLKIKITGVPGGGKSRELEKLKKILEAMDWENVEAFGYVMGQDHTIKASKADFDISRRQ